MTQTIEVSLIDVLNKIDSKIDSLEQKIESKIDRLDSRIDQVENKIDHLTEKGTKIQPCFLIILIKYFRFI